MQKLTEALIASLPTDGRDRIVSDPSQPGFGVRITAGGTKIFIARAKIGSQRRYVRVGQYPDTKLSDARKEAARVLQAIRDGRDPVVERAERLAAVAASELTLEQLADRWLAEVVRPKRKPRTVSDYTSLVRQRVVPGLGHLTISKSDAATS